MRVADSAFPAHIAIMPTKHPKRPRDLNQWAKHIVDLVAGETQELTATPDTPAQEFARAGGLRGGRARAEKLSPERRRAIAKAAARARWRKKS